MSSIPLPALQIKQQPDVMQQFGQAMQLKQLMNANQEGQLQLQQAQQDQHDRETIMQAFKDNSGDLDKTIQQASKAGVSPKALMGLQASALDMKTKAATLTKDQLDNLAKQNDNAAGLAQAVINAPPEKKQEVYAQRRQTLLANPQAYGVTDPSHVPPEQYPGDDAIEQQLAIHQGGKLQFDQEMKRREVAAQENNPEKITFDSLIKSGMSPPEAFQRMKQISQTGVDQQEMNDWLKKNPGKGPAEFMAYKAKLVPLFNFNLQAGGVPGTGQAPAGPGGQPLQGDALLATYGAKGPIIKALSEGRQSLPSSFALKSPYWQDVMSKLAVYDPQFSEQRAQLRKAYTVGQQSKEINSINTALGHVGVLGDSIDALNNGNVQMLNKIANSIGAQVGQTPQTTLKTIVNRVGPELVKAYAGSGGGVEERKAAESDFSPSMSPAQLRSNVAMTAKLLRSKISSLENQWNQNAAPGTPNFQDRFIMPQAKAVADKWAPEAGGTQPQSGGKEIHYKIVNGQLVAQ